MTSILIIPTLDDTNGVRTCDGGREYYFATIEDLKIKLWRALIDPDRYGPQLTALRRGTPIALAVTEAQRLRFYK